MKPLMVFGSETWAVAEMDMKGQGTLERKMLRRRQGPMAE